MSFRSRGEDEEMHGHYHLQVVGGELIYSKKETASVKREVKKMSLFSFLVKSGPITARPSHRSTP